MRVQVGEHIGEIWELGKVNAGGGKHPGALPEVERRRRPAKEQSFNETIDQLNQAADHRYSTVDCRNRLKISYPLNESIEVADASREECRDESKDRRPRQRAADRVRDAQKQAEEGGYCEVEGSSRGDAGSFGQCRDDEVAKVIVVDRGAGKEGIERR